MQQGDLGLLATTDVSKLAKSRTKKRKQMRRRASRQEWKNAGNNALCNFLYHHFPAEKWGERTALMARNTGGGLRR